MFYKAVRLSRISFRVSYMLYVTGLSQLRHERRKERMQACTIGMSIDEDIKLRSIRWWKGRLCTHAKS